MVSWQDGTILCFQLEAGEGVVKICDGLLAGWNHPLLPARGWWGCGEGVWWSPGRMEPSSAPSSPPLLHRRSYKKQKYKYLKNVPDSKTIYEKNVLNRLAGDMLKKTKKDIKSRTSRGSSRRLVGGQLNRKRENDWIQYERICEWTNEQVPRLVNIQRRPKRGG